MCAFIYLYIYLFIYAGHSSSVHLNNIHKIRRHSVMTSQAIHPKLTFITFITKISKVPAVEQMISESHFFFSEQEGSCYNYFFSPYGSYSVHSLLP